MRSTSLEQKKCGDPWKVLCLSLIVLGSGTLQAQTPATEAAAGTELLKPGKVYFGNDINPAEEKLFRKTANGLQADFGQVDFSGATIKGTADTSLCWEDLEQLELTIWDLSHAKGKSLAVQRQSWHSRSLHMSGLVFNELAQSSLESSFNLAISRWTDNQ